MPGALRHLTTVLHRCCLSRIAALCLFPLMLPHFSCSRCHALRIGFYVHNLLSLHTPHCKHSTFGQFDVFVCRVCGQLRCTSLRDALVFHLSMRSVCTASGLRSLGTLGRCASWPYLYLHLLQLPFWEPLYCTGRSPGIADNCRIRS